MKRAIIVVAIVLFILGIAIGYSAGSGTVRVTETTTTKMETKTLITTTTVITTTTEEAKTFITTVTATPPTTTKTETKTLTTTTTFTTATAIMKTLTTTVTVTATKTITTTITTPAPIKADLIAKVYKIVDGDTFDAFPCGRVRLADINTPERGEAGYEEAKTALSNLVLDKYVYLDVDNKNVMDKYLRLVCVVYVDYNATHVLNVNKWLLDQGYAQLYDFDNEFDPSTWMLYVKKG